LDALRARSGTALELPSTVQTPSLQILLVDDEPTIRLSLADALRAAGHVVRIAADGGEALSAIGSSVFDLVISDIRMPKANGLEVFQRLRQDAPGTDVILITAHGSVSDAVAALKDGATDYLTKPFEVDQLLHRVEQIGRSRMLARQLEEARAALSRGTTTGQSIIGRSPPMARLFERLDTFAASEAPVLITGESGTGKELVARALHDKSSRAGKPFVAVNCAAFPETLLEAELFGHERGAFTGAIKRRDGRFKAASGGTLFLDEIAEIPLPAQAKLLRVLQEGVIEPLGTNQAIHVDVRILSATHRNLKERIAAGLFREDLFYRLNVLDLPIPTLRDRHGDLPLLVQYFLGKLAPDASPTLTARAWAALAEYPFPGNVRELEHALQHAVVLSRGGEIDLHHLPAEIAGGAIASAPGEGTPGSLRPLAEAVKEFEREYLHRALRLTGGRKAEAAEKLGISRKNLWEKLRALDGTPRAMTAPIHAAEVEKNA
jgi:two-component system response regulator AtoC